MAEQHIRRTIRRRRHHRPPAIVGDPIEYPPDPYSFEARVGTMGFLARSLERRGLPRQHRWAVWVVGACVVVPVVIATIAVVT
jgi:hypothetical protein